MEWAGDNWKMGLIFIVMIVNAWWWTRTKEKEEKKKREEDQANGHTHSGWR